MRHFTMSGMSLYIQHNRPFASNPSTSDLFWSRPQLESCYRCRQLDIHSLQPIEHCLLRNHPSRPSFHGLTTLDSSQLRGFQIHKKLLIPALIATCLFYTHSSTCTLSSFYRISPLLHPTTFLPISLTLCYLPFTSTHHV
jgi:hypothetical protein